MNDLHLVTTIRTVIRSASSAWLPGLAEPLATRRAAQLKLQGLGRESYGLERFLANDSTLPSRRLAAARAIAEFGEIVVEEAASAAARYEALGLSFYAAGALDSALVSEMLEHALRQIRYVPGLARAIGVLVWTLIPLSPPSPEYDISHSDPRVPFSIFVSLTNDPQKHAALRLAEAILHEAMHLQLSLIEQVAPLVVGAEATFYSPWKRELRPVVGVLHGLYVFRAVDDFLKALPATIMSLDEWKYVTERRLDIAREIEAVAEIVRSPELTADGRALVQRLLRG